MATLAKNTPRDYELGAENDLPVIAADIIYEGSAVGDNASGYARPLVAGDPFRGFALQKVDNSSGSAGDLNVRVRSYGLVKLSVGSLAIGDVGKDVYASDDATFTLTQSTNTRIGHVHRFISTGVGVVAFEAAHGLAQIAELTDSTSGTANNTLTAASLTASALTENSGAIGGTNDGDLPALTGTLTDYTPHSSGGTTVTSAAATDLDTTAAALETFRDEQATLNTAMIAAIRELATMVNANVTDVAAVDTNTDNNTADLAAKVNSLIRAQGN